MLTNIKIIDLTARLPGPLAASLLQKKGASVIKVEDLARLDPFNCDDPLFSAWYREINQHKTIEIIDTKSEVDRNKFQELVSKADVIITSGKGELCELASKVKVPVVITLRATKSESEIKLLHDLNILAMKRVLTLHTRMSTDEVVAPPFLPVGGIAFASALALDVVSALYQWQVTKVPQAVETSLEEATEQLLSVLCPPELTQGERTRFLHNGSYPCYNIYRTKDRHAVAFAPIESKLWVRFCEIFNCSIDAKSRMTSHEEDPTLIKTVASLFAALTLSEIKSILASVPDGKDLCITPFEL